jgi:uncharacterized protein YutE (UPF0331/DUF86 family)
LVDPEIIATRLSKLREAVRRLREIARKPLTDYLASETDRALAEHYLRIALESALDTGNRGDGRPGILLISTCSRRA